MRVGWWREVEAAVIGRAEVDDGAAGGGRADDGVDDGEVAHAVGEGRHRRQAALDARDLLEEGAHWKPKRSPTPKETPGKSIGTPPLR